MIEYNDLEPWVLAMHRQVLAELALMTEDQRRRYLGMHRADDISTGATRRADYITNAAIRETLRLYKHPRRGTAAETVAELLEACNTSSNSDLSTGRWTLYVLGSKVNLDDLLYQLKQESHGVSVGS